MSALAAAPAVQAAVAPPVTIDGPSSAIVSLDGVALAQDGSGAVVYRKLGGGVPHVFAALESAGAWGAPVQLDGTIAAGASASAVAVSDGGRVAVVWISGGTLYGAVHTAGASAFSAPAGDRRGQRHAGARDGGQRHRLRRLPRAGRDGDERRRRAPRPRLDELRAVAGAFNPAPIALPSAGGPSIAVSADATAVVAWAQTQPDASTHVFVRRASAAGPSPVANDATVATLGGVAGGSADAPAVGVAYDSSFAWVAFRETFGAVSRVVVTRLLGDELSTPVFADSLGAAPAASSALAPSLAINGNGAGLLASQLAPSNSLVVAALGVPRAAPGWSPGAELNSTPNTIAPGPLAALSANGNGVVAYTPSAGALDAELFARAVRARRSRCRAPTLGPVVRADGLALGADENGDFVVGFVAGSPTALSVVVQPIVGPPGAPRATGTQLWTADRRPVLRWQASSDSWAPPTYAVYIDATRVATTTSTSYAVPADLRDGRHTWKVVAIDSLGQQAASTTRKLLIDAAPALGAPAGQRRPRTAPQSASPSTSRRSPACAACRSTTATGTRPPQPSSTHVYARAGRYTVTVTVTDRAHLSTVLRVHLTIS